MGISLMVSAAANRETAGSAPRGIGSQFHHTTAECFLAQNLNTFPQSLNDMAADGVLYSASNPVCAGSHDVILVSVTMTVAHESNPALAGRQQSRRGGTRKRVVTLFKGGTMVED